MAEEAMAAQPVFAPVGVGERIASMDVLRGAALLGIALMNIVFSGLPMSAYFNPKVAGGDTGWNLWAFFLQYVLFDGKMRGIFSLMFGAGSYLLITRGIAKGNGTHAVEIYYRRTMWLMLFGIVHAYLIWHGDILYPYALLGLILFPFHAAKPKNLLITVGVFIVLMTGMQVGMGFRNLKMYEKAMEAERLEKEKKPLTDEQKEAKKTWEELRKYYYPTADDLKKEREMYSGSYGNLLERRAKEVMRWHSKPYYFSGLDMFTMMLVGIAFVKLDVLTARRSVRFYAGLMALGYGIGLPVGSFSAWLAYKQGFEPFQTAFTFSTYQVARIAVTMGHLSVLLLLCKFEVMPLLRRGLAAIGQTAFSNYILHSLIYGLVFYGYGLGMFGKMERHQLYLVVLGMWIVSLIVSPLWVRSFQFGPLEWCWRSATYWKRQPMRIRREEPAAEAVVEASPSEPTPA
ncbi:MAG: DUF418 domain-containing protein [Acidobacteria bacterium]|nr:DUF418 domain-containing protein [Acidobacteriota bacterium]